MTNKRKKRGAYKKPEEYRRNKVTLQFTDEELAKADAAKLAQDKCRSAFIRERFLKTL